jgi:hypothetical protein
MTAIGILGFVFIIYTVITFTPHDYFFIQNPEIKKYVGINVVSPFATFSFFTYHSLIFFSTWLILFGIGNLLNSNHLVRFLTNSAILSFVCLNYFITCIIYTIFELLAEEITFGLYALTPHGIYNFITNIIVHYLLAFFALGVFLKIKASDLGKDQVHGIKALKLLVFPIVYLTAYYTLVKITGMHCYKIEWYPYPLFDVQSFSALFGLATNNNFVFTSLLLIALFVIAITYCSTLILLINYKRKTASKKN